MDVNNTNPNESYSLFPKSFFAKAEDNWYKWQRSLLYQLKVKDKVVVNFLIFYR